MFGLILVRPTRADKMSLPRITILFFVLSIDGGVDNQDNFAFDKYQPCRTGIELKLKWDELSLTHAYLFTRLSKRYTTVEAVFDGKN